MSYSCNFFLWDGRLARPKLKAGFPIHPTRLYLIQLKTAKWDNS